MAGHKLTASVESSWHGRASRESQELSQGESPYALAASPYAYGNARAAYGNAGARSRIPALLPKREVGGERQERGAGSRAQGEEEEEEEERGEEGKVESETRH
eukprot:822063-Rhodomonas_salina.1